MEKNNCKDSAFELNSSIKICADEKAEFELKSTVQISEQVNTSDSNNTSDFSVNSHSPLDDQVIKYPELNVSRNEVCDDVCNFSEVSKNIPHQLDIRVSKDPKVVGESGREICCDVSDLSDFSENSSSQPEAGVAKDTELIEKNVDEAPVLPLQHSTSTAESQTGGNVSNPCQENDSDLSYLFRTDIPKIGKNFFPDTDAKPFVGNYDLARQINEARGLHFRKEKQYFPEISFHELMRIKNSRTDAEKKADEAKNRRRNQKTAIRLMKLNISILKMLEKGDFDEEELESCFDYFLNIPISSNSLLYVPHFVHTIMYCQGERDLLSRRLRSKVNDCFNKCHCLFGIPIGLNFESVYTALVQRISLPSGFDKLLDEHPLEYEDFSEDESEFSESPPSSPRNDFDFSPRND